MSSCGAETHLLFSGHSTIDASDTSARAAPGVHVGQPAPKAASKVSRRTPRAPQINTYNFSSYFDYLEKLNKRSDLSGRPHCKGVAIGVARRGARRSGERTLRIPPSCSVPVSHSCGPHVASFVRRSSVRAGAAKFRKEAASCACGVLAAGARARRGAGGELQRLARRREATTAQAKNA